MTSHDEDLELEELLARRSSLSRKYAALRKDEPPPLTDARVLAAAARAAHLAGRPLARSRPRWMMPVVLAATVMMSVSIMWELGKDPTPVVARMAQKMRGPPPPVVVTLDPSASRMIEPHSPTPLPGAPKVRTGVPQTLTAPPTQEQLRGVRRSAPQPVVDAAAPAVPTGEMNRPGGRAAAPSSADLERVIAFLRLPAARRTDTIAVPAPTEAGKADFAEAELAERGTDADVRLRKLQRLYDAGDKVGALAILSEFERRFPRHPVSELLHRPSP